MSVQEKEIRVQASELSLEEKLDSLPSNPGVYQYKNADGKVIYVGKAQNLRSRVRQYFQKSRSSDPKLVALVEKIADVELIVTDSEIEALILEANLIKKYKPRYNVVLKDDKSYPYIVLTNEPFPRVFVTRKIIRDGSRYFGPYADVKALRFALKTVRNIFLIRSCNYDLTDLSIKKKKFKVCLDYHIKKCEGPCEGLVTREHYGTMIQQVANVLKGKTDLVVATLQDEMQRLSEGLRYEEAGIVRDRMRALRVYNEKQRVVDAKSTNRDIAAVAVNGDDAAGVVFRIRDGKLVGSRSFYMANVEGRPEQELLENLLERYYLDEEDIPAEIVLPVMLESENLIKSWLETRTQGAVVFEVPKGGEKAKLISMVKNNAQFLIDELEVQRLKRADVIPHTVKALQRDLRLGEPPRRIECFDNSNIQGSDAVASLVVFVDAKARKSEYRHFRIKSVAGPDDFASMREVVQRRYTRLLQEDAAMPDLIMVDGGKGQLSSAVEVLHQLGLGTIPVIGLAKRLEEIFVPESGEPTLLPRTSSGLRLLQQIRDEAHRFAITFHRKVRSKRILQSELDLVKGIGKTRAKELLEAFGSVQGVKFATQDQLAEIVGPKIAVKLKEYFAEEIAGPAVRQ